MHNNIINKASLNYSLPCNCCKQPVFCQQLRFKDNVVAVVSCRRGNATYYIRSILVWEISVADKLYENISARVFQNCIAITYYVLCDVCTIFVGPSKVDFRILIKWAWRTLTDVRVKLSVSLYTLRRHVGRVEMQLHSLLNSVLHGNGPTQWPCGLRRKSTAARLLRSWVRISPGAWMSVCCECCVLSGRGLRNEPITRPEESYRLWCVVVCDLEKTIIVNEEAKTHWGVIAPREKKN
jgi:hypothetical protein